MLTLLFFIIGALAIWTGITLIKKSPQDEEIKALLTEIASNSMILLTNAIKIFENAKTLFDLLVKSTEIPKKKISQEKDGLNLIHLNNKNEKEAA